MGCVSSTPVVASLYNETKDVQHRPTYQIDLIPEDKIHECFYGTIITPSFPGQYSPRPWHQQSHT